MTGKTSTDVLSTSEGARAYVAEFFANELRRHDFRTYITTRLAADFACALAKHLAARQPVGKASVAARFVYRHPDGREYAVSVSAEDVAREMPEFLLQALYSKICQCEPAGETNVIDCCCDEDAEQFQMIAPPLAQAVDLPYPLDTDPAGIRARVADVITGTLMVGAQGNTPPPAGHWAEPFWKAARADAAAHAVDLGQFRECVELMEWQERGHTKPDFPTGDPKKHAEALRLLALIDSQAVGNG